MQKQTRLWLAKFHSGVSLNITPPFLSHIHYCVLGELTEKIFVSFQVESSDKKYMYIS